MSAYQFEEGQSIYYTPKNCGEAKKAFTVASVNDEGLALSLTLESGAPTPSEALNVALNKTGATSAVLGKDDYSIELTHGHRPTSPHYTESRNFG